MGSSEVQEAGFEPWVCYLLVEPSSTNDLTPSTLGASLAKAEATPTLAGGEG